MTKSLSVFKIPYLVFFSLVIGIYILIIFLYSNSRKDTVTRLNTDAEYNSIVIANDISKVLEKSEMMLDLLEHKIEFHSGNNTINVNEIIRDFRIKYLNIYNLYIFDKEGRNYNPQPENPHLSEKLSDVFKYHKENLVRSYITENKENIFSFWISRAVINDENQIDKVLICSINIDEILHFDEIKTMYELSEITILDQKSNSLFSSISNENSGFSDIAGHSYPGETVHEDHLFEFKTDNSIYSIYKVQAYPYFIAIKPEYKSVLIVLRNRYLGYIIIVTILFIFGFFLIRYIIFQNEKQVLLEEKLARQSKLEAIGRVTGGVAHEFNNINAAIMSASELLKLNSNQSDGLEKQSLDIIIKSVKKATGIIQALLSYSRKNYMILKQVISISEIITNSVNMIKKSAEKGINIKILNHDDISLNGDHSLLTDAFCNLVENAMYAVRNGGVVQISYKTLPKEDIAYMEESSNKSRAYVEIRIEDNGSGISEENMSKIFDPFFSTKEFGEGTGLGLSSVYGIIKEHNGFINVESRLNEGTVFKIALPMD